MELAAPEPARADATALLAALQKLTPKRRTAVVLRFYGDMEHRDIAELMRCRVGTARSLVSRGVEDLRRYLND